MALPSPEDFGRTLGLRQDGRAVVIDQADAEQTATRVDQSFDRVEDLLLAETDERFRAFKEEFGGLFLLSLMRTLVEQQPGTLFKVYLNLTTWTMKGGQEATVGCRFVREQPGLTLRYFQMLAREVVELMQELNLYESSGHEAGTSTRHRICSYYLHLTDMLMKLGEHLPVGVHLPAFPANVRAGLVVLSNRFDTDRALINAWTTGMHPMLADPNAIDNCQRIARALAIQEETCFVDPPGSDLEEVRPRFGHGAHTYMLWWDCQLRVGRDGVKDAAVECQRGERMMACSRCGAVRYCSKEHQKADWKRHKPLCFQPTW